jgi:hypothetical protein
MSLAGAERFRRSLRLWRLRVARAVELAPTTVATALAAVGVLLAHRLEAGRGRGSLLAARPLEAGGPRAPGRGGAARARPAA